MIVRDRRPEDRSSIESLDVDTIVETYADVRLRDGVFSWRERRLVRPAVRRHDLAHLDADLPPGRMRTLVAVDEEHVVGVAVSAVSAWNSRLDVLHLYVDAAARRRGVARALLDAIVLAADGESVQHIWLETQTVNVPAIRAYERLGFRIVGLDQTLYADRPDAETALYLSRRLDEGGRPPLRGSPVLST